MIAPSENSSLGSLPGGSAARQTPHTLLRWRDVRLWVALLLLLGAGLRLFDLTDQPIDFHPTRQLRGMIIARGIYYAWLPGADPAIRQQAMAFRDSTGQYEPSILESLCALAYLAAGGEIFWIGRIYNTLFWLIGGLALWGAARRMITIGKAQAADDERWPVICNLSSLVALAFYLVLPFSVQASRSFQPDPAMVMWMALTVYALTRWSEAQQTQPAQPSTPVRRLGLALGGRWALLTGLCAGMALLTKAISIYTVAGGIIGVVFYTYGLGRQRPFYRPILRILASLQVWLMAALALAPTVIYYLSRQDRASEYLSTWTLSLSHLLLNPRFYLGWLALTGELLTPLALLLALAGIILGRARTRWLLVGLWLGYIAYGLFLPYQMDTHSYYHLQLAWLVALSMVPALQTGLAWLLDKPRWWRQVALGLGLLLLALGSWQALAPFYGRNYRNEPAYWAEIASYLPADGKILALTQDYGYRLMYYGWRKVILWPNRGEIKLGDLRGSSKEFDAYFAKRTEGKSYFLITSFNQYEDQPALQQKLTQGYPLIAQTPGYLIFDLVHPK